MFRAKLRLVASSLIKAVVVNILNNVFLCKFKTYAILVSQAVVVDSETIVFLCKIKACANLLNQALFILVVSIVESIIYFFYSCCIHTGILIDVSTWVTSNLE